jgi:uncharacterized phiE125 gp8 family phage protein
MKIVVPPEAEPVTVEELREQLRVDDDHEDALLAAKITAARRHVENLTGLAIAPATYEVTFDRFPSGELKMPKAPLISVAAVQFVDLTGAELTVDPASYAVDTASPDGWIVPVTGFSWPRTMATIGAVRIRFVAGFENVPETLREAILQLAAWWYEHREAATLDGTPRPVPFSVEELVAGHREYTF